MSRITINGVTIDPEVQAPALRALHAIREDSDSSDYLLVQTKHPLTKSEKAALAAAGCEILEYVPDDTYVCHYPPSDLTPVRQLPFVAFANVYMQGFKIAPALRTADRRRSANLIDLRAAVPSPARDVHTVDVVLHANVDAAKVAARIAQAAGLDPDHLVASGGKYRLRVNATQLAALAAIDEVRHIEPVLERKLYNNVARGILSVDHVAEKSDLQGQGQIIAVCDTGFDRGSTSDVHPAFSGRVLKLYSLGRQKANDPDGHGTHVCGSVLGDGSSAKLGAVRGSAPKAKLVMQSVLDPRGGLGGLPDDLTTLFAAPYQDGARVHSNSWGDVDSNGRYTTNSRELDDFVWKHRDAVIVFAAGNEGTDHDSNGVVDAGSVGSPGTAKNCITVGACENRRPDFKYRDPAQHLELATYGQTWPDDFPVPPLSTDRLANNEEGLVPFSSRGPTRDGRIKPDVVAPGTAILSTRSRATTGTGWGPTEDPLYMFEGGTSMATPLVSGCAAVVRQYLVDKRHLARPSAALVKALLINGARDLRGQYVPSEAGTIPNIGEGYGRVDLGASVNVDGALVHELWDEGPALETGEEHALSVALPHAASLVKVTLVWTDPPGETLQNDLDLVVKTPKGGVRHGNFSRTTTAFDRRNNVEQVVLRNVTAGTLSITVRAYRVTVQAQTFALVVRALA